MANRAGGDGVPVQLRRVIKRWPVLWLGAGASCQAEPPLPTLWQLIERLKNDSKWDDAPDENDPYRIIDTFLSDRIGTRGDLDTFLEHSLRPGGTSSAPGPLHRHLAALAGVFPAVVDTNYDLLLRRALDDCQAPYTAAVLDRNLTLPDRGLRYLSLHGSVDDWSEIILTGASYQTFATRYPFLQAQLDILLVRHPVLFVGCSLQDPRLLTWLSARTAAERDKLKQWVAILGPGEAARLDSMTWTDGRSYRDVLDHIVIVELPDFATLPRWIQALAEPRRAERSQQSRDLAIEIQAEADQWTFSALGETVTHAPFTSDDELRALRAEVCRPIPCDEHGKL
ncbi:MAG: SIR2 family protein, partial [Myxococcota bacterium]